jgi:hypothetical protein
MLSPEPSPADAWWTVRGHARRRALDSLGRQPHCLPLYFIAFLLTLYLFGPDVHPGATISSFTFSLLMALFAFLAYGWGLFVVLIGVDWGPCTGLLPVRERRVDTDSSVWDLRFPEGTFCHNNLC